jgi:Aminopeptidase P, N-terminal domain
MRSRAISGSMMLLSALLSPMPVAAQTGAAAPTIAPEEYAARRDSLAARLGDGVVLAFGAAAPRGEEPPHQLPAFRWLTGLLEPDAALVLELGVYVSTRLLDIPPDTPKNRTMIAKVRVAVTRYNSIGIRIEDDYASTPTGVEWLSRAPREPAEIESAMARRGH